MKHRLLAAILFFILIGTAHAEPITYYFGGKLNDSFGTVESGTIFTGSFSYDKPLLLSKSNPLKTYGIDKISLTFGTTTISEGYRGFLDVSDSPKMDKLGIRTYTFDGSPSMLGELGLYYMYIRLFDIFATALESNDLPGPNLTIDNFSWSRSIILQSTYPTSTAHGTVTYLSTAAPAPAPTTTIPIPEPITLILLGTGLIGLMSRKLTKNKK